MEASGCRIEARALAGFSRAESVEDYDSEFEMHVAEVLRHGGFKVETQVNEGEFRIDLAVVHPSEQRYAIGIKCDGATYHSSWTARSHDIWRQKVLQSCAGKSTAFGLPTGGAIEIRKSTRS